MVDVDIHVSSHLKEELGCIVILEGNVQRPCPFLRMLMFDDYVM